MIEGVEIGGPVRFVAEISNAHNGDEARCHRLIEAAVKAGADFVKFQAYTPDELVLLRGDGLAPEPWGSQGYTLRALYMRAATPAEWFPGMFALVRSLGAVPFASVFGLESLAMLEELDCPVYKVAALDIDILSNYEQGMPLWDALDETGKPVIGSVRKAHPDYDWLTYMLYCPEGYPQDYRHMAELEREGFGDRYDGFSYHGTDPNVPGYAVGQGAKLIETHFHLAAEPSELEANVSLTPRQFQALVNATSAAEAIHDARS